MLVRPDAPANFATVKHMASNLLRRAPGKDNLRVNPTQFTKPPALGRVACDASPAVVSFVVAECLFSARSLDGGLGDEWTRLGRLGDGRDRRRKV